MTKEKYQLKPAIVLIETSHPGNIGSVARIMDNMGLCDLRLVNPCDHLAKEAYQFATHADYILEKAEVFTSIQDALQDRSNVIGTTVRSRKNNQNCISLWDIHSKALVQSNTAFLFGRERTGLTNEELNFCSSFITIPTFGENSSLNLAQAVSLVVYELSKKNPALKTIDIKNAAFSEVQGLKEHWEVVLEEINFFKPKMKESVLEKLSSLIGKAQFTKNDVSLLRAFLNKVRVQLKTKH